MEKIDEDKRQLAEEEEGIGCDWHI